MKRIATLVVSLSLVLLPASAIAAGSSTCNSYNPQLCQVAGTGTTGATTTAISSSGTLPFTGLDVVLLAAGGGTLLAAGLVVRRLSRGLSD